uniref:Protein inhibitor of activated STAT, 4b n=1 Tax=Astyanax mexicanus TaxID=7994 RepID=A0A8B9GWQ7_ASTMX
LNSQLIRNMVKSLRVAELREFLSSIGKSKKGLKKELVQRVTGLLQKEKRPDLLSTIQELYKLRQSTTGKNRRSQVISIPPSPEVIAMPTAECLSKPDVVTPSLVSEPQMIKLPFYQTLETIVPLVPLVPVSAHKLQTDSITVCLTPNQWTQIRINLVHFRICYTESVGVEDDQYPPKISVLVNGIECDLQIRYASSKEGLEPSRPCCPINLTPLLRQTAVNRVTVMWGNYGKVHLLFCEKLCCDAENEIATTGLQVSLICPLAKTRMSAPCRAQPCAHLQCFDAAFYLQMNERKPRWTCPVCHKPALFETLQIDRGERERQRYNHYLISAMCSYSIAHVNSM